MTSYFKRTIFFFFIFTTLTFFNSISIYSQQLTDNQIKLGYIYNFLKNITWKEENTIDTFRIAVFGNENDLTESLKSMESIQIRNKPIRIKTFGSISTIGQTHVLIVSKKQNSSVKEISEILKGTNTLLITDRCEFQRYVMINFVYSPDSLIKFEVNTKNMDDEGFTSSSKLILLGGTEIDVRNLYIETEKILISEKEKSEFYEKELKSKKHEIEDLNFDLAKLYGQVEIMRNELALQKNELSTLNALNIEQKTSINEKNITLEKQKQEISRREEQLMAKEKEIQTIQQKIKEHNTLLNSLKTEIDERQQTITSQGYVLNSQQARIRAQRWFLILLAVLIIMSLALLLLILRNFRIRKKRNIELENQHKLVKEQRDHISVQNQELEMHRNQLEDLVKERTADLIAAKERAEESERLKSSFLANMSHEIRTPLNAIVGFLDLITNDETDKDTRIQYNEIVQNNSAILLQLINDILDFAFIESGQMKMIPENENLYNLMHESVTNYQALKVSAGKMQIEIKTSIPDKNLFIYTDKLRFKQILTNLVDNALKYTEKGSIEIGFTVQDNEAIIYVKDTGIGIPAEKHNLIFDRFAKIEDSMKKLYRGVGLGLAICKKLVELMNGRIWIESEPGKGSCFYFTQPVSFEKIDHTILSRKHSQTSLISFSNKTILICEDDDSNYLFLKSLLSNNKLEIYRANDGLEAIKFVNSGNNPDLILMDIKMPFLDGIETTKKLKNEMGFKNPIIAQTAYATYYEKKKYEKYFDAFITKPVMKEELYETLNNFLRN